jgi:hypothetical protein
VSLDEELFVGGVRRNLTLRLLNSNSPPQPDLEAEIADPGLIHSVFRRVAQRRLRLFRMSL